MAITINGVPAGEAYVPYGATVSLALEDTSLADELLWEILPPVAVDGTPVDAVTNWPAWSVESDGSLSITQPGPTFPAVTGKPDVYHSYLIRCTETRSGVVQDPPWSAVMRVRDPKTGEALPGPGEDVEADPLRGWSPARTRNDAAIARTGGQVRVHNATGVTITKRKVVQLSAAVDFRTIGGNANPGGSATIAEKLYSVSVANPAHKYAARQQYAVLGEDIAAGAQGWAYISGDMPGNFTALSAGTNRKIFCDLNGDLAQAPQGKTCIEVGTVVDANAQGKIAVSFVVHKDGEETEPSWFGADEDATTDDRVPLTAAMSYCATYRKNKTVRVAAEYLMGGSVTLPAGCTLRFEEGGKLIGSAITINCKFAAPRQQLFTAPPVALASTATETFFPEWWGAKGNGSTNDNTAIQYTCTAVTLAGGGEINLNGPSTYLVGIQDQGVDGLYLKARPVFRFANFAGNVRVVGNGAKIKTASGLKYGSFNPGTGLPYEHGAYFTDPSYAATTPNHFEFINCSGRNKVIGPLVSDGNNMGLVVGGRYGDAGIQLPGNGMEIIWEDGQQRGPVHVTDVDFNYHPRDGWQYGAYGLEEFDDSVPGVFERCKVYRSGRQGVSLIGSCGGFKMVDVDIDDIGRGANYSPPGAGIDIEAEGSIVRRARFIRVRARNCLGNALVAASGDSADCYFEDCEFIAYAGSGNCHHVEIGKGFRFYGTRFCGGFVFPSTGGKYKDCHYDDDPHAEIAYCNLVIAAGTYAAGSLVANVSGDTTKRFFNRDTVVVTGTTKNDVVFVAQAPWLTGAPQAAAGVGTINQIYTPVTGWTSITNTTAAAASLGGWTLPVGNPLVTLTPPDSESTNPLFGHPVFENCEFKARRHRLFAASNASSGSRVKLINCEIVYGFTGTSSIGNLLGVELHGCRVRGDFATPPGYGNAFLTIGRASQNTIAGLYVEPNTNVGVDDAYGSSFTAGYCYNAIQPRSLDGTALAGDMRKAVASDMRLGASYLTNYPLSLDPADERTFSMGAIPPASGLGSWKIGDLRYNPAATAEGATIEARCTTVGDPGTWTPTKKVNLELGTTRIATASPVTIVTTDLSVMTDLAVAGAVTANLPSGAAVGWKCEIGDAKGDATINNISIVCPGGETFCETGTTTLAVRDNFEVVTVRKISATKWKAV